MSKSIKPDPFAPLPPREPHTKVISIRLTAAQRAALNEVVGDGHAAIAEALREAVGMYVAAKKEKP